MAEPPPIVAGRPDRQWMSFGGRAPYRCLPLSIANTTGWEILCPAGFTATWNGGQAASDITITSDDPAIDVSQFVLSHFAFGTLTFHTGYLFRTDPGHTLLARGAPNHIKHGIQALEGLIETEWLSLPFTMNWLFTAPGSIRFEKGEPICFISIGNHAEMDAVEPVIRSLHSDPVLMAEYVAWTSSRASFNQKLHVRDPETVAESWQKFYFKGTCPHGGGKPPEQHVSKRRLKEPRLEA